MRCQHANEEAWKDRYSLLQSLLVSRSSEVAGDRIIVVVQKTRSVGESLAGTGGAGVAAANKVKRGDLRHAIIVRTKKMYQRKDGMVVRFDDNACALIGKNGEPLGTRINGKSETSPWNAKLLGKIGGSWMNLLAGSFYGGLHRYRQALLTIM